MKIIMSQSLDSISDCAHKSGSVSCGFSLNNDPYSNILQPKPLVSCLFLVSKTLDSYFKSSELMKSVHYSPE